MTIIVITMDKAMADSCLMLMHYVQGCVFDLQCFVLAKANSLRTRSVGLVHNAPSEKLRIV